MSCTIFAATQYQIHLAPTPTRPAVSTITKRTKPEVAAATTKQTLSLSRRHVMVNRGPSRGCITCKERRVKCDETKPACNECVRVKRRCAGYVKQAVQVRFKDETARYLNKPPDHTTTAKAASRKEPKTTKGGAHAHRTLPCSSTHVVIPASPQPKRKDLAVAFFLTYVTDVGRNLESTRGFLEFVRPVLAAESHNSAMFAAVNATAIKLWARIRPSDIAPSLPIHLHNQALVRLQQAIDSPVERGKEATVFAALMLQQHDTLAAIFDHRMARGTHREGALALLSRNICSSRHSKHRGHLLANLFHSKISACVRQKVPLTGSEVDWLQREVIPALPNNPSSLLDVIGISISRLQSALQKSLSSQGDLALSKLQELPAIIHTVSAQLRMWSEAVPELWRPRRIQTEFSAASSVITYHGSCDIYPSLQIANIWNTWRTYSLIVEQIKLELTQEPLFVPDAKDSTLLTYSTDAQHLREIQDLIESMCRSMPFYLGNRARPASFTDIDHPQLVFPSYHDLPPTDEAFVRYNHSDHYDTRVDHYRHVVLHGPLHALSILSSLTDLLAEGRCSAIMRDVLDSQKQWIDEQFHRCLHLMCFVPRARERVGDSYEFGSPDHVHQASPPTALVQATREALCTVTIL